MEKALKSQKEDTNGKFGKSPKVLKLKPIQNNWSRKKPEKKKERTPNFVNYWLCQNWG